jgi:DNA-binding CsgD family transcriptional regulator
MSTQRKRLAPEELRELREAMESGAIESLEEIRAWIEKECGISYSARGVAKLVEREFGARRKWVFPEELGSRDPHAQPLEPQADQLLEFLCDLQVMGTMEENIKNIRCSLLKLFPGVDRISMYCNLVNDRAGNNSTWRMIIVDCDSTHKTRRNAIADSEDIAVASFNDGVPPSDHILANLRKQGAPLKDYNDPIAINLYGKNRILVGILFFWNKKTKPPLTLADVAYIRRMEPFIIFLLQSLRERHAHINPALNPFHTVIDTMTRQAQLTLREFQTITLRFMGQSYQAIAKTLYISRSTVHKHILSVHRKTGTSNIVELFAKYFTPLFASSLKVIFQDEEPDPH